MMQAQNDASGSAAWRGLACPQPDIHFFPPRLDRSWFQDFTARCTADDLRLRFGNPIRADAAGDRLFDITLASTRSLAAFGDGDALWALAQIVPIAPGTVEAAIMVRSDCKRRGIGRELLTALTREARAARLSEIRGTVLAENAAMCALARKAGFMTFRSVGFMTELRLVL